MRIQDGVFTRWFAETSERLAMLAHDHESTPADRRRPLARCQQLRSEALQANARSTSVLLTIQMLETSPDTIRSKSSFCQESVRATRLSILLRKRASKAWLGLEQYAREALTAQDNRRHVLPGLYPLRVSHEDMGIIQANAFYLILLTSTRRALYKIDLILSY